MKANPLVSIICLCYNHSKYLIEALNSVINQTYKNLQIILVDDASTDDSQQLIRDFARQHPRVEIVLLEENIGNCAAFNKAFAKANGELVIDFATDDVMLPHHVQDIVEFFLTLDDSYGIVFTDAVYIDGDGHFMREHFRYLQEKKLLNAIPQGDVFRQVLTTYFVPSPTMVIRSKVLQDTNGYDETLAYEDFNLWVLASRNYKFGFLNKKNFNIRRGIRSMSTGLYQVGDRQLESTYRICVKAKDLCRDVGDINALQHRVRYEYKQSLFSGNTKEAKLFLSLLKEIHGLDFQSYLYMILTTLPLPWASLRQAYYRWKY